jgi:hypothetical protein
MPSTVHVASTMEDHGDRDEVACWTFSGCGSRPHGRQPKEGDLVADDQAELVQRKLEQAVLSGPSPGRQITPSSRDLRERQAAAGSRGSSAASSR